MRLGPSLRKFSLRGFVPKRLGKLFYDGSGRHLDAMKVAANGTKERLFGTSASAFQDDKPIVSRKYALMRLWRGGYPAVIRGDDRKSYEAADQRNGPLGERTEAVRWPRICAKWPGSGYCSGVV